MPIVVDGKKIADDILSKVREDISAMHKKPTLVAILVGSDPASVSFLNEKKKKCEEVGIAFALHCYPEDISTAALRKKIYGLRNKRGVKSCIVQLPLPKHINTQYILDAIPPQEDIDALSSRSRGLLATGKSAILPPTAGAVMEILERHGVDIPGSHCVLVGLGPLVGRPLLSLLAERVGSLCAVHVGTPDIARFTREADILIVGAGKAGLIGGDMVKEGVVALDAGYSRIDGKTRGDIRFDEVSRKASIVTPVPGGIGPITVAMLLKNISILANKEGNKTANKK